MGLTSLRRYHGKAGGQPPSPNPQHITWSEHQKAIQVLTNGYEIKLLELRKKYGDLPESKPEPVATQPPIEVADTKPVSRPEDRRSPDPVTSATESHAENSRLPTRSPQGSKKKRRR